MPNIIRAFARSAVGFPTAVDIETQDVGSGPGRAAYVKLGATNPNSLPATALAGTDSLAAVSAEQTDNNGWRWRLYAAMLTVEGAQTIRGTWSDGNNAKVMGGCVVSGVDPGNIIAGLQWANNNANISQPRWAVPSAVGGLVIALFATDEFNTNTPEAPAAALTGTGLGSGVLFHAMQQAGAAGDVDIDSTLGTVPAVWRGFAFNVPAGGGGTSATANGATVTSSASIVVGTASGQAGATAAGVTLSRPASLIPGGASGEVIGLLNFQAAGLEFGRRTGLAISTFALDAGASYRYTVHANTLTLGAAILTSSAINLDAAGKLPNLSSALITPGTTYRIVAIRQADGEAAIFRMTAA